MFVINLNDNLISIKISIKMSTITRHASKNFGMEHNDTCFFSGLSSI